MFMWAIFGGLGTCKMTAVKTFKSGCQTRNELDLIIKLGGAAITKKDELETAKLEDIKAAAKLLRGLKDRGVRCVIVHGAGSFGHHTAAQYEVNKGNCAGDMTDLARLREGFCKTRVSVTKLNHIVTDHFVQEGVPAIGMQACGVWKTASKKVTIDGIQAIDELLTSGYIPVLHGDCVLDESQGCCILSGDTIIMRLCEVYSPKKVVFLTDVDGVYDKPPHQAGAKLLPTVRVNSEGILDAQITTSTGAKDVTGGMVLKLDCAISIVKDSHGRIPVIIGNISGNVGDLVSFENLRPQNATFIEYTE